MKFTFYIIILATIVAVITYGAMNWQKYGNFTGKKQDVALKDLASLANFYDSKDICTTAFLIQSEGITILKENFDDNVLVNSVWINNTSGKSFFVDALGDSKGAKARVCGKFKYGQGFGQPSVWKHQIDVADFEMLGKTTQI